MQKSIVIASVLMSGILMHAADRKKDQDWDNAKTNAEKIQLLYTRSGSAYKKNKTMKQDIDKLRQDINQDIDKLNQDINKIDMQNKSTETTLCMMYRTGSVSLKENWSEYIGRAGAGAAAGLSLLQYVFPAVLKPAIAASTVAGYCIPVLPVVFSACAAGKLLKDIFSEYKNNRKQASQQSEGCEGDGGSNKSNSEGKDDEGSDKSDSEDKEYYSYDKVHSTPKFSFSWISNPIQENIKAIAQPAINTFCLAAAVCFLRSVR